MKIGITGHQYRAGIDWDWVRTAMRMELAKIANVGRAYSSLAVGSDQTFAEVALGLLIPVSAVLPLEGYERFFEGEGLSTFRRLLSRCEKIELRWKGSPDRAFFEAGRGIVDYCDILFAVWDGENSKGLGGTADIVEYALGKSKRVIHLNPITKTIESI
jgi:hypothetical protein